MSLHEKTVTGVLWSIVENFSSQGINFVIGIILARLLLPEHYGLLAMIIVFIAISRSFLDSGFSQALIRKRDCTIADYSTVFFFNLMIGVVMAILLFSSAALISGFFDEPELINIVKVMSVLLIIDSIGLVQRTILIKNIDFKLQTKISIISDIVSGIVAIVMAYRGFGVWSLVVRQILSSSLTTLLLWNWNKWTPSLIFSISSLKELFSFGSKLLLSGLLYTFFQNIYLFVIGKYFSSADLGFYTRADQFKNLPSQNINNVIQRVTYPVLAQLQDDIPRLKDNYRKIIRSTMFITLTLMFGLAAVSEDLILSLLGEKWLQSVIYLQLLVFVGMFYPLHSLNLNMLKVQGKSGKFLQLEIIKKTFAIPVILAGIFYGIEWMIIGMIINSIISYFLNSFWSGKLIGYSTIDQLKDLTPSFLLSITMGGMVFFVGKYLPFISVVNLLIQIALGGLFILLYCEISRFRDYIFLKEIIVQRIKKNS